MTLLDYASKPDANRPYRWRWLLAVTIGLLAGLACGLFGLQPMLHAIVGDAPVKVGSHTQLIPGRVLFVAMAGISGIVVACSGLAAAGSRKMWFGWPILALIIFALGMGIGMVAAQWRWDQEWAAVQRISPQAFLPRRWLYGPSATVIGFYAIYQIPNFIALAPPICGSIAVLGMLALLKLLRVCGLWKQHV